MRTIQRRIVAGVIISKDNKILMGKKDPTKGGVWTDCWHIPGGGKDKDETDLQALTREVKEESGIDIATANIKLIPYNFKGAAEKTIKPSGERVLCEMDFTTYEVRVNKNAIDIQLNFGDDLIEPTWFNFSEIKNLKLIPGAAELYKQAGYTT